eukprot:Selendium_serpulae@DN3392_c0_g1_i1.p1
MAIQFKNATDAADFIKNEKNNIKFIDVVFIDPLGLWHHTTLHKSAATKDDLEQGYAFDGSSIKLFTKVENSDMVMTPDYSSCWVDPFYNERTLHILCNIVDSFGKPFNRCPRGLAKRCENFIKESGVADKAIFGVEPEFFIFDNVQFSTRNNNVQSFFVDGEEASWNNDTSNKPNLAHRVPQKSAYFPAMPIDSQSNLRSDMLLSMHSIGIPVEKHHHEVASCQHELGFTCRPMLECADQSAAYKYVVKNVAKQHGKTATFMPKPLFGDCGSGMHCHQSLWKDGKNLFWDEKGAYMKLSDVARWYIGGLLKHACSILAFSNPTVNSYKRLVPGYEAPSALLYSKGNRSAAIRIPLLGHDKPGAKRLEFRCPDPMCNPYLAFSAMVMAGIDGVVNKIEPPEPCDTDIYEKVNQGLVRQTPGSLNEVLDALEENHDFLTVSDVFPKDFITAFIAFKRAEARSVALVPTPKEYELYYHL